MKNKKLVVLGDTHGRSLWKQIVSKESDASMTIFIGDYFDTHGGAYSANRQIENFKDILEFKKQNMDKVTLLTGNHDHHYLSGVFETYSGYQKNYTDDINKILEPAVNEGLLQMCYVDGKFVFTHAGVTKTWVKNNNIDVNNLQESINNLFKENRLAFNFTVGPNYDNSGDDITQTPIWVRPESLNKDIIDNVMCVVGHTTQRSLFTYNNITLIDTLGTTGEYLSIIDGVSIISRLDEN